MKKNVSFFIFILYIILFAHHGLPGMEASGPAVLVSIAPHKYFVERIAGNKVGVGVMVPPGANAHTYEPTPKQVSLYRCAKVWFQIGEGFEVRATRAIKAYHPEMKTVDLREGIDLISDVHHHGCCAHGCEDPHIWLSPKLAKQQATTILNNLIKLYPEEETYFRKNTEQFFKELEELDKEITLMLKPVEHRAFMVSHPAYGYFARDYKMEQLSIEFEGKDPSPQQLTKILQLARSRGIKTIFIQLQFNNKGARLIADQIGAKVVTLDPYTENFFDNMRETARGLANP